MKKLSLCVGVLWLTCISISLAQENSSPVARPDAHAPIGVMGDHLHKKGEFMLSYRFMNMKMEDNRDGTDDLTPETIVTTVPNRFFGMPMQPPTLRVVPTSMTMQMHMFGMMYAPADWITVMAMVMLVNREMDHITFQGGMGTTQLGTFTTKSSGFGDTRLTALIKLLDSENHKLHFNAGVSFPTGSITEQDEILTPMNMRPTVRMPYPMQLGSGTVDLLPGITYLGFGEKVAWGGQLLTTFRTGESDEEYSLGNFVQLSAWTSYMWAPWISSAVRFTGVNQGEIDGIDPTIKLPVQTADPDFQGGTWIEGSLSVNLIGQSGFIRNHRLAIEYGIPWMQDLNGPQMKLKSNLTLGWQYAF